MQNQQEMDGVSKTESAHRHLDYQPILQVILQLKPSPEPQQMEGRELEYPQNFLYRWKPNGMLLLAVKSVNNWEQGRKF